MKGGLTKKAIQRLTVGVRIAIRIHSKNSNVQQLWHDLRNGPTHVFGDHSSCNPAFCKFIEQGDDHGAQTEKDDDEEKENDDQAQSKYASPHQPSTLAEQISDILAAENDEEPTPEDEVAAQSGYSQSLANLPDGLFRKVMACGDRLVVLAPQLSSLAITRRPWCDFVVWTLKGMLVECIKFDPNFWEDMKSKLVRFHREAVLPELALPRHPTGQSIREPLKGDSTTM